MGALPKKVILAVTSYKGEFYPDGAKTGLFYSEGLHPFEYFTKHGYTVDVVSETGQVYNDEHSISKDFLNEDELKGVTDPSIPFNKALKNIKKPSQANASDYGIFFAAGGHGTDFDFIEAQGLHDLASAIYKNGGVVSAVCHGPLILSGVKDEKGDPLVVGKKVTGFTDAGEENMGLTTMLEKKSLPFVERVLKSVGGVFVAPAGPWDDFVVTDGRLVTGPNPASATSVAKAADETFSKA